MIEHIVTIRLVEDVDNVGLEITTPETLTTIQVVGVLEMAKKQFIDSKHETGPTIYQVPETLNHDNSDRWTGGDKKDAE
jgi:hypothetical protein